MADAEETAIEFHTRLLSEGVAVKDGFLSQNGIRRLTDCAELRHARGGFTAARIGGHRQLHRPEIRGDSICWLDAPLQDAEQTLLDDLEVLRLELNREGLLGLFDLELHYARYPPGAGYARHVDQPRGSGGRRVSLIVYLNEGWRPQDGGELRVFDPAGGHRDIAPAGGRLVCFMTDGLEHAVQSTRRDRLSVTGWFRHRDR